MTLGWFANALNSVSKVGQKIGSGISKIGEKTGKVIQAGEKVLNTGSNILHDPVGSLTHPGETLGSMSEAASGMVGSLGGLASTVNNVGSDIGGPLWDNSPLSTIGFLGEVGSEAGRTLDISSKVFRGQHVSNSEMSNLGRDVLGSGLEYGLNRLSGGMAKKYGMNTKNITSKLVKSGIKSGEGAFIGDVIGTASGLKNYRKSRGQ